MNYLSTNVKIVAQRKCFESSTRNYACIKCRARLNKLGVTLIECHRNIFHKKLKTIA